MAPQIDQNELMKMLQERGLILQPNPLSGPELIFRGVLVKRNAFCVETLDDEQAIVSMEEYSTPLIEALNEVIGYKAVFRYYRIADALAVVEWKRNYWSHRWDEVRELKTIKNLQIIE